MEFFKHLFHWFSTGHWNFGDQSEIDQSKEEFMRTAPDELGDPLLAKSSRHSSSEDSSFIHDGRGVDMLSGNDFPDKDPYDTYRQIADDITGKNGNFITSSFGTAMNKADVDAAVLQTSLDNALWQNTQSYEAQVNSARSAGLNPFIVAGQGVGSTPSVNVPSQKSIDPVGIMSFVSSLIFKNKEFKLAYDRLAEDRRQFNESLEESRSHNIAQESLWASQVNLNADQLLTNSMEREKLDKDLREADERLDGIKTDNLIKGVKLKVDTFIQEHQQEVLDMQKRVNDAEIAYKQNKTAQGWRKLDLEKQEFNANMRLMLKRFEWDMQSDLFDKDISIEKLKNEAISLGIQVEKLNLDNIKTEFGQKKALADVILKAVGIAAGFMIGGTAGAVVSGGSAMSGSWSSTSTME